MLEPLLKKVKEEKILIAAHRGGSISVEQENTMEAFASAIESGADLIELDIRLTKDQQIVCYHDELFDGQLINGMNFNEITNPNIPLLSEVLEKFNEKIYFVVEIKPLAEDLFDLMLGQLASLTEKYDLCGKVVFATEEFKSFVKIKDMFGGGIYCAAIYSTTFSNELLAWNTSTSQRMCIPDSIICYVKELTQVSCFTEELNKQAYIALGVYGVETEQDILDCLNFNVKIVGTDHIGKIHNLLKHKLI